MSSSTSSSSFIALTVVVCLLSDAFAYGMSLPNMSSLLSQVGVEESEWEVLSSTIVSIHAGSSMIFFPPSGIFVSKSATRKFPLIVGLSLFSFGTVMFFQATSISWMLIAKGIQGASSSILWIAAFALCYGSAHKSSRGALLGIVLSANDVGSLISPPVGGAVFKYAGRSGLLFTSLTFLLVSFILTLMITEISKRENENFGQYGSSQFQNFERRASSETLAISTTPNFLETTLISQPKGGQVKQQASSSKSWLLTKFPFLFVFQDVGLVVAIGICAIQAALLGVFDATIPLESERAFQLQDTTTGLLFIPIGFSRMGAGILGGWAVDRWGPRLVAVVGYSLLVPVLLLFDITSQLPRDYGIAFYCVLLAFCGAGMGGVATASFVEAGNIADNYHEANPHHFGDNGPLELLFGMNLMVFSLGMTVGAFMGGDFREWAGYGNMMAVLAACSCIAAFAANNYLEGGGSKWSRNGKDREKIMIEEEFA